MSRIYWDTMLSLYLLEENPLYFKTVQRILERSYERNDQLFTSYLTLGEIAGGLGQLSGAQARGGDSQLDGRDGLLLFASAERSVAPSLICAQCTGSSLPTR